MAEIADLYEKLRNDVAELVSGLEPEQLETPVPATPGWTIKDVITHVTADATCVIAGDFPREFFEAFGEPAAVAKVNDWTARQLADRQGRSFEELLQEWKASATEMTAMMRGEGPWPADMLPFTDRIILTDLAVHQQDIFGALGIEGERESVPVKLGMTGYIATIGWRLPAELGPVHFDVGDKSYTTGDGEPKATVSASRFEFFRSMSGRRSPEQIAAYAWDVDPEPYISYFFPYGIRQDALVE